jgi:acyl carrier protein
MPPTANSIQKLLLQKLNINTSSLSPKTNLKKDLDLVDWELLYLLNAIEETWNISIHENDLNKIVHMKYLMEVVRRQLNAPTAKGL